MKTFIMVRHGDAYETKGLTDKGRHYVRILAQLLAERLKDVPAEKILLLSSPVQRALETARIIACMLEIETIQKDVLKHEEYCEEMLHLVTAEEESYDVVIVVGHYQATAKLPCRVGLRKFPHIRFPNPPHKGYAHILDMEKGSLEENVGVQ